VLIEASVRRLEQRVLCFLREVNFGALASEAQRYFDVAFDNAPIGMALFNCDGEYVRVNAALCELLGRPADDLLGRRDQELTHPDDRQADVDAAWKILGGELSTQQCEKRFVRPDGSVVWALANLTFLRDEAGRPLSWVGQFQDVTARRAAEEALRASEERHRLVVRNLPGAGVALYDRDLRCVLIEGRHVEDAGLVASELVGRPMHEIVSAELLAVVEPAARRALAGEDSAVEAFSPQSGRIVLGEVVPHRIGGGEIAGVLISVRDVTDQRLAERATRDAEERFRLAFDHAPIGLALVSPEGRWLRVNGKLCEMTGYGEDELLATTFQDITHPDDLDADLGNVREMLAGEIRTYEMEKRYIRADGTIIWILLSVSLVRDGDGRPLAIAVIDLNEFKQVNDMRGHEVGDRLLKEAVAAWGGQLRGSDLLARLGGDEFAVLLPDCGREHLDAIVRRLKRALPHAPGCAIGVALCERADPPRRRGALRRQGRARRRLTAVTRRRRRPAHRPGRPECAGRPRGAAPAPRRAERRWSPGRSRRCGGRRARRPPRGRSGPWTRT
jgi:PAS domain S-box-containing protein